LEELNQIKDKTMAYKGQMVGKLKINMLRT